MKRKFGVVALLAAGIIAVVPAPHAAAENDAVCALIKVNGRPIGKGECEELLTIARGLVPGSVSGPGN